MYTCVLIDSHSIKSMSLFSTSGMWGRGALIVHILCDKTLQGEGVLTARERKGKSHLRNKTGG